MNLPSRSAAKTALPAGVTPGVRRWLLAVYFMILAMVVIGGITRLTGSGLSMVDWRPLMGTLPPMNETEWNTVFDLYKQSPQYTEVNHWMKLDDFKQIFFWEYLHRLWGRLIGLVFFVPWLYFVVRRKLRGKWAAKAAVAFLLGGGQALLGWYMVKSGLVHIPEVSHYRLASHLSLAFFVGAYVWWLTRALHPQQPSTPRLKLSKGLIWGFMALLVVQIVWGAFMAGTRAGWLFQTWPDMNGVMVPESWLSKSPVWVNAFENPVAIHFLHRTAAWLVGFAGLAIAAVAWRRATHPRHKQVALALGGLVVAQFVLGVITVVAGMPIWAAASHQGVAFLLLTAAVSMAFAVSAGPRDRAAA
ncbi:MAG: COX15/CtaA family protein [Bradymonadia bacterium]